MSRMKRNTAELDMLMAWMAIPTIAAIVLSALGY